MRKSAALILAILLVCLAVISSAAEYRFSEDADAIENAADSVFMLEVYSSSNRQIAVGSGFVVFRSDLLATNYHVIEDGAYVIAVSDDSQRYSVSRVCAYDKNLDTAILQFDTVTNVRPLELCATDQLKRGQTVVAIGSPAGLMNTISMGNISAFYKQNRKDWIQFTAPISSGSSGGALFNDQGKVIGITTATYSSAQNVNMAVRSECVAALYNGWDGKTTIAMNRLTGQGSFTAYSTEQRNERGTVYVSPSGTKYHSNPNCSKMKNAVPIDLLEAIGRGYTPCGKCFR